MRSRLSLFLIFAAAAAAFAEPQTAELTEPPDGTETTEPELIEPVIDCSKDPASCGDGPEGKVVEPKPWSCEDTADGDCPVPPDVAQKPERVEKNIVVIDRWLERQAAGGKTDPATQKRVEALEKQLAKLNELAKKRAPNDPKVLSRSANQALREGRHEDALADAKRALMLGAKDARTLSAYAAASYHLKDMATASHAAALALQADPSSKEALAVLRLAHGGMEAALPDSRRASRPPAAADEAAPAPSQSAFAPARSSVQDSGAPGARESVAGGAAAFGAGDYRSAYARGAEATAADPKSVPGWNLRAFAAVKLRRYADAEADAGSALALSPGNPQALQARSWARARQKNYRGALEDADLALERDPYNGYHYQNKAYAQAGLGDRTGALDSLRRSAEQDPHFVARFEAAAQSPKDADLLFLFDENGVGRMAPAWSAKRSPWRSSLLRLALVAGAALVAAGAWNAFGGARREEEAAA